MEMKNCKVCHRLTPKEIRDLVYEACNKQGFSREQKHKLFVKTLDIILFIDKVSLYCCGKNKKSIVSASLYISGILLSMRNIEYIDKSKSRLTQRQISRNLKITECSIRGNYVKILEILNKNKYGGLTIWV